ncbi:MAG: type II toxin-antitoxin system RelE/ParE family toxin [Hyphomicrobium sp.]
MPACRLRYTRTADRELDTILDYIAERKNETTAIAYVAKMRASFRANTEAGFTGHPADDLYPGCRKYVYRSHTAILRVRDTDIAVLHIFHGARNIPALLAEEFE